MPAYPEMSLHRGRPKSPWCGQTKRMTSVAKSAGGATLPRTAPSCYVIRNKGAYWGGLVAQHFKRLQERRLTRVLYFFFMPESR
jgi:hypothetical protein